MRYVSHFATLTFMVPGFLMSWQLFLWGLSACSWVGVMAVSALSETYLHLHAATSQRQTYLMLSPCSCFGIKEKFGYHGCWQVQISEDKNKWSTGPFTSVMSGMYGRILHSLFCQRSVTIQRKMLPPSWPWTGHFFGYPSWGCYRLVRNGSERLQFWLEGYLGHCVFQQVWWMSFPKGRLITYFSTVDLGRRDQFKEF